MTIIDYPGFDGRGRIPGGWEKGPPRSASSLRPLYGAGQKWKIIPRIARVFQGRMEINTQSAKNRQFSNFCEKSIAYDIPFVFHKKFAQKAAKICEKRISAPISPHRYPHSGKKHLTLSCPRIGPGTTKNLFIKMDFINKIELRGRVGRVTLRPSGRNGPCRFTVVTNFVMNSYEGEIIESTWFNVLAWPSPTTPPLSELKTGDCVHIWGRVRVRLIEIAGGLTQTVVEVLSSRLVIEQAGKETTRTKDRDFSNV